MRVGRIQKHTAEFLLADPPVSRVIGQIFKAQYAGKRFSSSQTVNMDPVAAWTLIRVRSPSAIAVAEVINTTRAGLILGLVQFIFPKQ